MQDETNLFCFAKVTLFVFKDIYNYVDGGSRQVAKLYFNIVRVDVLCRCEIIAHCRLCTQVYQTKIKLVAIKIRSVI